MKLKKILLLLSITILLSNCNSSTGNKKTTIEKTAYDKMEVAFIGNPMTSEIQPTLEKVMKFHGIEVTENNLERTGSVLVTLRKESKIKITEMDILNHMNKNGTSQLSFPEQAAISLFLLEAN
ncbi:hypothetical protein [Olleya sp. HaHaR_3_96]|uniref:hypothetical protein n=1 Tax=Olleya sp. HaHaR_3_96 TaxID=2745560 RepID=UPI001C4EC9FA|nr:hypothetical protein [Olleya sp. HaHaR_3_96]QXP61537.1 hypothetical protein H0I26_07885 [Olleya sp. HaHaR_3_96]